jgi:uncharacterized protein YlaI
MPRPEGPCALCRKIRTLNNSHFMTAALYKLFRIGTDRRHVVLTPGMKPARTTKQIKAYLLCDECEERFNKEGENWVLANGVQENDDFPLQSALKTAEPKFTNDDFATFSGLDTPGLELDKLGYFAISILWRAAVFDWSKVSQDGPEQLNFGPYREQLRLYLLGGTFPDDACLFIYIAKNKTDRVIIPPRGGRAPNGTFHYSFHIPGFLFMMVLGKKIPQTMRSMCSIGAPERLVILTNDVEKLLVKSVLKALSEDRFRYLPFNDVPLK